MIVNTAYIYMGSAGGPVNPVIFNGNEINYRYSGTNFIEEPNGFRMQTGACELVFTGLDLSNFVRLRVEGTNDASGGVSLTVNFIDNSGNVSTNITRNYKGNSSSYVQYDIPAEYRNPKTKIKFSSANGRNLLLKYANLS